MCKNSIERRGVGDVVRQLCVVEIVRNGPSHGDVARGADAEVLGAVADADLGDTDLGVVHQQLRRAGEVVGESCPADRRQRQASLHARRVSGAVIRDAADVVEKDRVCGEAMSPR